MADDTLREQAIAAIAPYFGDGVTGSPRFQQVRLIDAVLAVVEARIAQARQDGMTEALDWAASNPGYWAQKVAAHVVEQFESTEEPT